MKPILLVDDEATIREVLRELLVEAGFDVIVAVGGAEAIGVIRSSADIGILVTDVNMPDVDGFEVGRVAAESRPDLPVIFITGRPDVFLDPRAPSLRKVLRKPFVVRDMIDVIRSAVLLPRALRR